MNCIFHFREDKLKIIRDFWSTIRLKDEASLSMDFVHVSERLFGIYKAFKNFLREKGLAYEGMIYREVIDKIESGNELDLPFQHYVFIGFNAINECERRLFKYLKGLNRATFFWDYDLYYTQNPWHEAGRFIRENMTLFPSPSFHMTNNSLIKEKDITIIAIPSDVGQAKMVGNLLSEDSFRIEDLDQTAIVLADEKLLIPVITSLPAKVNTVNVSLGYPMHLTSIYSFVDSVINLQQSIRKSGSDTIRFYHRDVILVLDHPYLQRVCADQNDLKRYIIRENRIFLSPQELGKNDFLQRVFRNCTTYNEFLEYLLELGNYSIQTARQQKETNESNFEYDYWFSFLTALNRLSDLLQKENIPIDIPTFIRILRKLTFNLTIPFRGEPLSGLQVLGMLETRCLDFKHIILLSANEGILPKNSAIFLLFLTIFAMVLVCRQ